MRLGETATAWLNIDAHDPDGFAREALRRCGINPVSAGFYRVVITKLSTAEATAEIDAWTKENL